VRIDLEVVKLNLTDATRHSGPSWRRLAVRPRPRVPASPGSVRLTAATWHSGPPSLVPGRRNARKRPSRASRPPPGIGPRCGGRSPRPPGRAGPGHTVRARSALGRRGHVRSHARCPAFGLTVDTRLSVALPNHPAPGLTGLGLRPRPTDASLSRPGAEPEALTTAAVAERARILPGAPAHPPAGGPGPGPPQRAEAERQVVAVKSASLSLPGTQAPSGRPSPGQAQRRVVPVKPTPQAQRRVAGVKTCFGPGQTPAVWHRPGPAPGSSSEARPQARPRQKKFSPSFFHFFHSTYPALGRPRRRRPVAAVWPHAPRPRDGRRVSPPPPGRPTEASRGVDRLGDSVPALTPSREPHFRAALPRRVLAAARELHRER